MKKILIITGDPIGEKMAGPAIRAWNFASHLSHKNLVRLVTTNSLEQIPSKFELATINKANVKAHEQWSDLIIFQGHALVVFPELASTNKILVADLYDPFHLEQLASEGNSADENQHFHIVDHASGILNHQLLLSDYFICASERQRLFWLGSLAALGRLNPKTYKDDNLFSKLIRVIPFGIPDEIPQHNKKVLKGIWPGISADDKILIWGGGIYEWFDPYSLIKAMKLLEKSHPEIKLFFLGTVHPNKDVPEMVGVTKSRNLANELGILNKTVFFNDTWVDYAERHNYLLEADAGVSTHFVHVETTFAFRTRILDYLWAGLPIVSTEGDAFADLILSEGLGAVVPENKPQQLKEAIVSLLTSETVTNNEIHNAILHAREKLRWSHILRKLDELCEEAQPSKDRKNPYLRKRQILGKFVIPDIRRAHQNQRLLNKVFLKIQRDGLGETISLIKKKIKSS